MGEQITHNMVQGVNRECIFRKNDNKQIYINLVKKYTNKYNITILAYCIMDNHAHLLLHSLDIKTLGECMRDINSIYAMHYNKENDRVGYVFRSRFKTKIMLTERQLLTCIKYIHMNPVKANIVEKESQYKFSSYNDYFQNDDLSHSKFLNQIFQTQVNYLEKLKNTEYKEIYLEDEKIQFNKILQDYLEEQHLKKSDIIKEKSQIKKFISYLVSHNYIINKTEIAQILQISRAKLYRMLKD